ncbi:hypothetical protein AB0J83_43355 [Actinoplanes sp. NPDC049596]|uniref:hypothetical protein n=1 Tax=unclassified Actinoplanes TaxID=2626549 RepID=UPI00342DF16B
MLIEKQTFLNAKAIGAGRTFADLELVRCEFTASHLANYDDPGLSLVVRDVVARRPVVKRSGVHGVRFENVLVEGLTGTLTQPAGCVFRHVTLRGRSGALMIVGPNDGLPPEVQQAFTDAIVKYYQDVDWALDITEAEFDTADLYYLPGDLVRRDPETQFLLRRPDAVPENLPAYASIALSRFESTPFDTIVAVAPKRSKNFAEIKEHYQELRVRGLAD